MIGIWCTISYSSEILACHSLGNSEHWMTSAFTSWAVKAYCVSTPLQDITWSLIPLVCGHLIWCFCMKYTFCSHSQTVHVTKATAWSLHPQRVVCVWERGLEKSMKAQVLNSVRFSWALSYAGTLRKYGSYGIQLPSNHWFRAQLVVSQNLYLPQEPILVKGCCCLSIQ